MATRRYSVLAQAAVLATLAVIIVGGIVRVTGSGMGCPDWPKCYGQWIPTAGRAAWLEQVHRYVAGLTSLFVAATATAAWRRRAERDGALGWALAGVGLLLAQIALGAVTVFSGNRGDTVVGHLLLALLLLGVMTVIAVRSVTGGDDRESEGRIQSENARQQVTREPLPPVAMTAASTAALRAVRARAVWLVALTLTLSLFGSAVQVTQGGFSCPDFPLCGGELWPAGRGWPAELHMLHRGLALATGLVLLAVARSIWQLGERRLRRWVGVALTLFGLQALVGIAQVELGMPTMLRAGHLLGAALLWVAVVALATLVSEITRAAAGTTQPARAGSGGGARATQAPSAPPARASSS